MGDRTAYEEIRKRLAEGETVDWATLASVAAATAKAEEYARTCGGCWWMRENHCTINPQVLSQLTGCWMFPAVDDDTPACQHWRAKPAELVTKLEAEEATR